MGRQTTASGRTSFSAGYRTTASGYSSVALGFCTTASGGYSTASGKYSTASGDYSTAMGQSNTATGTHAVVIGCFNQAQGKASFSGGNGTRANSFAETVVGTWNTTYTACSTTAYNACDKAFVVGTGSGYYAEANAFEIYKDGSAKLIPMPLASVCNATAGVIMIDSSDSNKLKFHDGTAWRTVSFT